MKILSFDTSTDSCSVALCVDHQTFSRFEIAPRLHAQLLLPMIDTVLCEAKIHRSDLNAIAFGSGPGSFMGVRLATGMAQGLAFGLSVPVIPISTLQTLAQTVYEKTKEEKVFAGWDARMGEIYEGFYTLDNNIMKPIRPDALSAPKTVDVSSLPENFVLAGNAWSTYKDQLSFLYSKVNYYPDFYPEASSMLTLAKWYYEQKKTVLPENAKPDYIRQKVVL